jgi:DNA polymerase-3 subunit delta'
MSLAQEQRLPHAMLFTSQEGGGAMPLVLELVKYILCLSKTENGLACGDCNSCNSVDRLTHPDLFLTFPFFNKDSNKKYTCNDFIQEFRAFIIDQPYAPATAWIQSLTSENKQGNISAAECQSISSKMMLKSILGGAKILIVWYAEFLGKDGNRLLKLIEEPPKNTYLFFVAENTSKILGTILSRTQHFAIPPIPNATIEAKLVSMGLDTTKAQLLAKQSEGNFYKAQQLSNQNGTDHFNHLRDWLNALYTNNGVRLSNWLKQSAALGKEELKSFFIYAERIFEQSLRVMNLPESYWSLTETELRLVKGLISKGLQAHHCEKASAHCSKAAYQLERNVYKKVLLHAISFAVQESLVSE